MKYTISIVIFAMLMCLIGCSDNKPRQNYEKSGAFSFDPPPGWNVVEFPGLKYKIAHGPIEHGFAPNINILDETFKGSLDEYVDANLQNMEKLFSKFNILSQEKIRTLDNEPAVMLVTENEQQESMLRQTFMFIGSGKKKYVVTCTALAENGDKFDPDKENALKNIC